MKITTAVVHEEAQPFSVAELEEPRSDEVLVRIVATGVCHTDLIVRDQWYPVPLPSVLGHEGAGVVEQVQRCSQRLSPQMGGELPRIERLLPWRRQPGAQY